MVTRILAGIGGAVALLLSGTAVASADVSAAACDWGATRPYKYQDELRGTAYSTGCNGGSFKGVLQHKHPVWGWSGLDDVGWTGNKTVLLTKMCDNKSNYQYRTMISARNNGGGWSYRYSPIVTLVC